MNAIFMINSAVAYFAAAVALALVSLSIKP